MPSVNTLPVSRLVNVAVNLTPQAAQAQDLSTLLILGDTDVIDVVERLRTYETLAAVAADFGVEAAEYLAATLWFEQAPQPTAVDIGRWAQTATFGELICAPLSAANQLIATWNAIANGGFKVTVDGGAESAVGPIDFSGAANLNAVAALIQAAILAAGANALCRYNSVYTRFEIESVAPGVAGAGSSISFLTVPAGGTDIATLMAGLVTSSGAYVADGIPAESAAAAAAIFDATFGQGWYALMMPTIEDNDDHLAVAAYIEASDNKHLYGATTQEAGAISAVSTTDLAYLMSEAGYKRTMVQYSSENAYAVASLFGRALTVNYDGNNTVITLMYKQEPGIVAEYLSATQADALADKNCNVFVNYNNDTAIIQNGVMSSGDFIDILTGTDWLAVTIMTALYNVLYTTPTKIPQTADGIHILTTTVSAVCSQALRNGLLGPGVWNSQGFGTLAQGDFLPTGFYVYAQPLADQTQAAREARQAPPIQVAAKLAGAVHTADVTIFVNR